MILYFVRFVNLMCVFVLLMIGLEMNIIKI